MTTKIQRPLLKIAADDLTPIRPRLPETPDEDDQRILAGADRLSARHGALRDGSAPVPPTARSAPEAPTAQASWKLMLPDYLDREIARQAADRQVSKNFLVLEALAKTGYVVQPEDMVGDRRRRRK